MKDVDFDEKCRALFNRYDDDGSGEIDAAELGEIFAALGRPMEDAELAALVTEIDADGSGTIDFEVRPPPCSPR